MKPLPFLDDEQWRWRWIHSRTGREAHLHRVVRFRKVSNDLAKIWGVTLACGVRVEVSGMPGVLSRIGAPRCKRCCKRLGIPTGDGAPYNAKPRIVEPTGLQLAARAERERASEKAGRAS